MLNVLYKYFTVNGEVENLKEFRDESKKLTTSERLDMAHCKIKAGKRPSSDNP